MESSDGSSLESLLSDLMPTSSHSPPIVPFCSLRKKIQGLWVKGFTFLFMCGLINILKKNISYLMIDCKTATLPILFLAYIYKLRIYYNISRRINFKIHFLLKSTFLLVGFLPKWENSVLEYSESLFKPFKLIFSMEKDQK